jgi:chromatin segregation and condensation protein Rec8/ScpA/Scc1 (kleisin family)
VRACALSRTLSALSRRTVRRARATRQSKDEALSYNAMVAGTKSSAHKRKVVAGCFQELLFLATHGMIELQQAKPYGNILVGKTELFDTVAAP